MKEIIEQAIKEITEQRAQYRDMSDDYYCGIVEGLAKATLILKSKIKYPNSSIFTNTDMD